MHPAPKIAALQRLHAAGLPVPRFVVLHDPHDRDPTRWSEISTLLRAGPVIVRTALFDEDREHTAAAGLGTSIPDCTDLPAVHAALARINAALTDPWLHTHLGPAPRAQILIQHQIIGPWLAVVAQGLTRYVELHPTAPPEPLTTTPLAAEPLAAGTTPSLAAPLDLLPTDLRDLLAPLCDRITAALPATSHGLDLELAADNFKNVWVVQARPLTRPLHPEWPAFAAAADLHDLPGLWTLDAEHNPAPLSPAHASLIRRLAAQRPDLVTARVLAGWLYEPSRPRTTAPDPSRPPTTAAAALHALRRDHIPAARAWLTAWDLRLAAADPTALAALLDLACDHLLDILAIYAALRVPAAPPSAPALLCLQDRQAHLDVLPAAWDIASPPLADLPLPTWPSEPVPQATQKPHPEQPAPSTTSELDPDRLIPSTTSELDPDRLIPSTTPELRPDQPAPRDTQEPLLDQPAPGDTQEPPLDQPVPQATQTDDATLLRELDDHLFALGLAPLRRLYLRAAALLHIPQGDIFLLPVDELQTALRHPTAERRAGDAPAALSFTARRAATTAQAALYPPLQLLNGLPVPAPARTYLQGLAIGPPATGALHVRGDLADLLARPLPDDAILAMPALTAQAAVALHALAIRAVCCEHGGAMSHAALMARELGLSALIGCRGCTTLPPGIRVHLDTRTARLRPA